MGLGSTGILDDSVLALGMKRWLKRTPGYRSLARVFVESNATSAISVVWTGTMEILCSSPRERPSRNVEVNTESGDLDGTLIAGLVIIKQSF